MFAIFKNLKINEGKRCEGVSWHFYKNMEAFGLAITTDLWGKRLLQLYDEDRVVHGLSDPFAKENIFQWIVFSLA